MSDFSSSQTGEDISPLGESFRESLAQTANSQRALFQEMAAFTRSESLRFANLRMERTGAMLDKLQTFQGVPGLIGLQQEWLRDLVQDYVGQNVRLAGAWSGIARDTAESVTDAASDAIDQVQQNGEDALRQGREMTQEAGEQMNQMADAAVDTARQMGERIDEAAQDTRNVFQETQH